MPEEVLFEVERRMDRSEIAAYLRTVAGKLESNETVTLSAGDQSVSLAPPARPTFEVKVEHEGPEGAMTERSIEFELEWDEAEEGEGAAGGDLSIE